MLKANQTILLVGILILIWEQIGQSIISFSSSFSPVPLTSGYYLLKLLLFSYTALYGLYLLYQIVCQPIYKSTDHLLEKVKASRIIDHSKLPPSYPNGWFKIMMSTQLKKGEVKPANALGQKLAVYRGFDGEVRILDAHCPHLGAHLAVQGEVQPNNSLRCIFHGWCWDGKTGDCVEIPYEPCIPKGIKTRTWPVYEKNGIIYMYFDVDGKESTWKPISVPHLENSFKFVGESKYKVATHIQEVIENGADLPHLNALHRDVVGTMGFLQHKWEATFTPGVDDLEHTFTIKIKQDTTILGKWKIPLTTVNSIVFQQGPGVVVIQLNFFFGKVIVQENCTPIGPVMQQLDIIMHVGKYVPLFAAKILFSTFLGPFESDIPIWNNKKYIPNPLLVKSEKLIKDFRRWFSQFYSDNSPRATQILSRENIDW